MTREARAISKASGTRLCYDMQRAARLVAQFQKAGPWGRAATVGAIEAPISLTLRACLVTAFGG